MNKFLPGSTKKSSPSPELREKIDAKKREIQKMKKASKAADAAKKSEIESQIKTLKKELKVLSPKVGTW